MPIQIIPKNVRTILHFGSEDIHIVAARMHPDNGDHRMVIFHQTEPREIGSGASELDGTFCDDFAVGMTFSKAESIDSVISVLTEFKEKEFGANPNPEPVKR